MRTLSGTHPFQRLCLEEEVSGWMKVVGATLADPSWAPTEEHTRVASRRAVAPLLDLLEEGVCPRCGAAPLPEEPELPAGSKITSCRCVPICETCGGAESHTVPAPISRLPTAALPRFLAWAPANWPLPSSGATSL